MSYTSPSTIAAASLPAPSWSFQGTSGDCTAGMFVANSATSIATTQVLVSGTNDGGTDAGNMAGVTVGSIMQFTDTQRRVATFSTISVVTMSDGCLQIGLTNPRGMLTWGGRYNITFSPAV